MFRSVRNLLTALIDYAGLFPPAGLDMSTAIQNFEQYRAGEFAWALGRFIVPASRLAELHSPLPLSVLAGTNLEQDLVSIQAFHRLHPGSIDSIEIKVTTVEEFRNAAQQVPSEFQVFFEVPVASSPAMLIAEMGLEGACAKVRTGGITADAIPGSCDLVHFMDMCAVAGVPFKATAGLHHTVRGVHALTYEQDSPSAVMHGFLNLFLAAALLKSHTPRSDTLQLIEEQSPAAFHFDEDGVRWREHRLTSEEITETRRDFAIAFGSCSFEEPISELRAMGLL
jgi:hypothetical protein